MVNKDNIVYIEYNTTFDAIWESEHLPLDMPLDVYMQYIKWRYETKRKQLQSKYFEYS